MSNEFPSLAKWILAGSAFAVLLLGGFLWLVWKGVKRIADRRAQIEIADCRA